MDGHVPHARLALCVLAQQPSPAFAFGQVQDGAGVEKMASVIGSYVPTYEGLSATDFVRGAANEADWYPFSVAHRLPFYRARNAIYHLFRALLETNPGLSVLAPDYYSGNEILAMHAAGATLRYYPIRRNMTLDPDDVERCCRAHNPGVLYVIHYAGWAQP